MLSNVIHSPILSPTCGNNNNRTKSLHCADNLATIELAGGEAYK